MPVIDTSPTYARLVQQARSDAAFKAAYWAWLDEANDEGPLAPMLHDFTHLWSGTRRAPALTEAREAVARVAALGAPRRAEAVLDRFAEVTGVRPDGDVVLVTGLAAPEGYSRFDRGRNTIFIGLDHKANLEHVDHFEVILAHELCHAVRDPSPDVLRDYGGWPAMGHDDFVSRYALREHLVSEALATAISEACYPHKGAERYAYLDQAELTWCEAHRREVVTRIQAALDQGEDYRTFYRENVVAPGAPSGCDYHVGLYLGRFALTTQATPGELLRMPSKVFLERFLPPFLEQFLGGAGAQPAPSPPSGRLPTKNVFSPTAVLEVREAPLLPAAVQAAYRDVTLALTRDARATEVMAAALQKAVADDGLLYRDDAYEVQPFPLLLGATDMEALSWTFQRCCELVEKVVDLYVQDKDVRAYFGFPAPLEQLILVDPGYRRNVPIGRFDSYWDGHHVRLLELNTNGTAGMPLAERAAALFAAQPLVKEILDHHGARPFPLRGRLRETLVACWREATGAAAGALPKLVAIVDYAGVPTEAEFHLLAKDFTKHGVNARFVDPKQLQYDGKRLSVDGQTIDVVYRRLTTLDFLQPAAALDALKRAYKDRAVVMVGSFRSDVAHSKKLFAFLTDERWRHRFTHAERTTIDAHIPWTRVLRDERTLFRGRVDDLPRLAIEHREHLILKPTTSFEGRGVMLGTETPADRWAGEISRIAAGGTHILQERVAAPLRTFIIPRGGRMAAVPQHLHLGEYVFDGKLAGFQVWASDELVISVQSTERAVPCLELPAQPD